MVKSRPPGGPRGRGKILDLEAVAAYYKNLICLVLRSRSGASGTGLWTDSIPPAASWMAGGGSRHLNPSRLKYVGASSPFVGQRKVPFFVLPDWA